MPLMAETKIIVKLLGLGANIIKVLLVSSQCQKVATVSQWVLDLDLLTLLARGLVLYNLINASFRTQH